MWLALVLAYGPNGEARAERAIEVKLRAHNDFYSQIDEVSALVLCSLKFTAV